MQIVNKVYIVNGTFRVTCKMAKPTQRIRNFKRLEISQLQSDLFYESPFTWDCRACARGSRNGMLVKTGIS